MYYDKLHFVNKLRDAADDTGDVQSTRNQKLISAGACIQVWEALYKRMGESERGMYITTLLLHPQSIGTIRLQSSNPQDDPLIDPRLLTDSNDVSTLIDG